VARLAEQAFALPGVQERPSLISVPGARALWLQEDEPAGPPEAFMVGREFAHIHPLPDGSLHMVLPADWVEEAVRKGWAEPHPLARSGYIPATVVMVYGPRDAQELEVVMVLLRASHGTARSHDGASVAS
jgi:phospholipase/carboxylesterase